jgi:competence protein ComEC
MPAEDDASFDASGPGMVATTPVNSGQRQHLVVAFETSGQGEGVTHRVCVTAGAFPAVSVGDSVRLGGRVHAARDAALAHRAFLTSRGCGFSMFAESIEVTASSASPARMLSDVRSRLGETLRLAAPGDAGVLLSGLVTGDDAGFSQARHDAFTRTGTTHLTAVSGSNLALVAGMLAAIGGATVGRRRVAWQIATVCGVWAYAAIAGAEAPALRAAIVASAAILAFRVGRRPDFVTLVLLAAGAMALIDPGRVESLGFRLSVAASLALAVVLPSLMARGRGAGIAVVIAATAAAQFATLPFLLPVFGTVSLTSIPANVVAAPLVAVAMPIAGIAGVAGLLWQPLAEPLAAPAVLAATGLIAAVDLLGAPSAYVSVGIPPFAPAVVVAVTATALLALMGTVTPTRWQTRSTARRSTEAPAGEEGRMLAPPAALVLAGEDPLDALGADLHDAEEDPAGEEKGHQLADQGNVAEALP